MTATAVSEVDGGGPFAAGWVGRGGGGAFHGSGPSTATPVDAAAGNGPFTTTAVGVEYEEDGLRTAFPAPAPPAITTAEGQTRKPSPRRALTT